MPNILAGTINGLQNTIAIVGATSAEIIPENTNRVGLIVINLGQTVSLGLNFTAVINRGITLGSQSIWNMAEYDFTTAAIHAVGSSSGYVSIQEFTR